MDAKRADQFGLTDVRKKRLRIGTYSDHGMTPLSIYSRHH